ncbi:MAG: colanic acid biosynthesis acetyltransferase WcaF [Verrucomicrobiales bacterium]|nr:colanic acid biosynthesis acetyltransferase WcaF [Verrucomicrobiales bacterium]
MKVELGKYRNSSFDPGASLLRRVAWYLVATIFFTSRFPIGFIKLILLRAFGAEVGGGVVIKPGVNIKSPWLLKIGSDCWIGENVWIDNLVLVTLGSNVCISQGAVILTGNHDYKCPHFSLTAKPIVVQSGVWIGAFSVVCPGVTAGDHSVLTVGSVASRDMDPFTIYRGNPAVATGVRKLSDTRLGQTM